MKIDIFCKSFGKQVSIVALSTSFLDLLIFLSKAFWCLIQINLSNNKNLSKVSTFTNKSISLALMQISQSSFSCSARRSDTINNTALSNEPIIWYNVLSTPIAHTLCQGQELFRLFKFVRISGKNFVRMFNKLCPCFSYVSVIKHKQEYQILWDNWLD